MSRLICPRMAGPNPRLRADDGQPFHKSSKARLVDQPGITPLVDTSAFVGTNLTDEQVTSRVARHSPETSKQSAGIRPKPLQLRTFPASLLHAVSVLVVVFSRA
jgi:hypothetical protein